jgi:hypothetical protein
MQEPARELPPASVGEPRARTPVELQRLIALDRLGAPYLVYRDETGAQVEVPLAGKTRLTLGRDRSSDIGLWWDPNASRVHAELECRGEAWVIIDDGLSTNGTFVNGERVRTRWRLRHGDVIGLGSTVVAFRAAGVADEVKTAPVRDDLTVSISPAQRRVLEALCGPLMLHVGYASPATNAEIAAALFITDRAVKNHLKALYEAFQIQDLPQNAKRARLAQLALYHGLVRDTGGTGC